MDTKKMTIFLEAVKIGSLKKAAERLNYTQSGLVYLMNSLENELGVHLLNRTTKGICLTPEGEVLMPQIQRIVEDEKKLIESIHEIQCDGTGKLRIGTYPIFACNGLPSVIKQFIGAYPENEITIRVATDKELPQILKDDEVDLAIAEEGLVPGAEFIYLMDYEVYAAIPTSFHMGLKGGQSVGMEQLKNYPILFSSYNRFDGEIDKRLQEQNAYRINVDSADGSALLRMTEEGLGVSFLSELYISECPESVEMVPLMPPVKKHLGIVVKPKKKDTALVRAIIPYLKQYQKYVS